MTKPAKRFQKLKKKDVRIPANANAGVNPTSIIPKKEQYEKEAKMKK